jgi:bacterioferritin (cytochrome b1)
MRRDIEMQAQLNEERARQQCGLLEKTWDTMNEISAELKNRGISVDPEIYASLRSTKTLITLCKTHPKLSELLPREIDTYLGFCVGCCGQDVVTRVKCELRNVEDRLIIQAMNELGNEYALRLQQKTVKAWEPFHERIIAGVENLEQAVKVERDVLSAYQRIIEENISYWLGVEEDIVDSYTKIINRTENVKLRSVLTELIQDSKNHIEALGSIRESFKKILADEQRHAQMLQELL